MAVGALGDGATVTDVAVEAGLELDATDGGYVAREPLDRQAVEALGYAVILRY